jgi:ABC-type lipoprotein export system ATPase subunit
LKKNFDLESLIDEYSNDYLICDVSYPLITNASFNEEILLYNIETHKKASMALDFYDTTGKQLRQDSDISLLSGGQKVVLMVLLALYSPAEKILFLNLQHSLDRERLKAIEITIEKFRTIKHEIRIINNAVDYQA